MGSVAASVYVVLMGWAYISQIVTLVRRKKAEDISLQFLLVGLGAVTLRMITQGVVVEQTKNSHAIILLVAEGVVLLGLIVIVTQILYYRHKERRQTCSK